MDNVFWTPRVRGDWNRDGTTDCNGQQFQPCNATEAELAARRLQELLRLHPIYLASRHSRSRWPAAGNMQTGATRTQTSSCTTSSSTAGDGGHDRRNLERRAQNGFISMMAWYRRMIDACRARSLPSRPRQLVSGNYEDMRYGLASTLMDDAYFYINAAAEATTEQPIVV